MERAEAAVEIFRIKALLAGAAAALRNALCASWNRSHRAGMQAHALHTRPLPAIAGVCDVRGILLEYSNGKEFRARNLRTSLAKQCILTD